MLTSINQRFFNFAFVYIVMGFWLQAHAASITIAAASDLKFALDETIHQFRLIHPQKDVKIIYGSSGKIYSQIQQGAPYDLYFSADISYPNLLVQEGLASGPAIPHALGRLVLWTPNNKSDANDISLAKLASPSFKRIAIANPKHAPYGKRAEEALKAAGVWTLVQSKLVYGENVSQTAQFVQTGNAEVGIIALSLALSRELANSGRHVLIDDDLHAPLEQGFVITKRAERNELAHQFSKFMVSEQARQIMKKYGFMLPHEQP